MADDKKNIVLRIPHKLFNQVAAKRDTIPGGMSFNSYTIAALHNSLQQTIKKKNDDVSVSKKAMLHLLHLHVVSNLVRSGIPYNEAIALVDKSITTGKFCADVTKALNETIASLETMQ